MARRDLSQVQLGLPRRLWFLLFLFAFENTAAIAIPHPWFTLYLYRGLPIVFGLALLFFGRAQFRRSFHEKVSLRLWPIGVHLVAITLLLVLDVVLLLQYSRSVEQPGVTLGTGPTTATVGVWLTLFPVLAGTLLLSFLPLRKLWILARSLGTSWLYAGTASALVIVLRERFRVAWSTSSSHIGSLAQSTAFEQAQWCLKRIYPVVVDESSSHLLGTDRFCVIVGGTCSGLEGLALVSAFSMVWLVYARRELRIIRALFLIPAALALMWFLNIARLVALIAIGDAGHPEVATQGFHSEAGWIAFNVVSLAFLLTAQQISFFRKAGVGVGEVAWAAASRPRHTSVNFAAVYLGPFLAITAVSVISQAASAGFEPLYPLRFFFALAILWLYRREYQRMDWRFSAAAIVAGLAIAAMWLGLHNLLSNPTTASVDAGITETGLQALSPWSRGMWITIRVLSAVVTVPIAEELAFRGYVARRVMDQDPQTIAYSRLSVTGIVASSLVFGLVHGHMWVAGIVAGLGFALLARWKNRLGEAVVAHAVANLSIAVVALYRHDYSLW